MIKKCMQLQALGALPYFFFFLTFGEWVLMQNLMVDKEKKSQGLPSWRSGGVWRVPQRGWHESRRLAPLPASTSATSLGDGLWGVVRKAWWPSWKCGLNPTEVEVCVPPARYMVDLC